MLTVTQLGARHDNETVHTAHVARLADELFLATRAWLGLPAADRKLIAAAARLHDIGYAADPVHHPERGAALVRRTPLRGLTVAQRRLIAAAIPLHNGPLGNLAGHPRGVLTAAAFLRVADGLDHGHLQDAALVKVSRVGDTIRVAVHSPHFPANVARANAKADLWRAVFPLPLEIVPVRDNARPVPPLAHPDLPVAEAARRLLTLYAKHLALHVPAAGGGDNPAALHDVRVAVRRLRLLLRVFRRQVPPATRRALATALGELNTKLGPARDLDVWLAFLEDPAHRSTLARSRRWLPFLAAQRRRRAAQAATVRQCLHGSRFAATRRRLAGLVRVELPRRGRESPPGNLRKLAARSLARELARVQKRGKTRATATPAELHRLRIALRRARYLGEFFGLVLGKPTAKLTRRLHAVERTLGRIHDLDAGLVHARQAGPPSPRALLTLVQQRRQRQLRKMETAWRRLAR